jgi:hypothetical protein
MPVAQSEIDPKAKEFYCRSIEMLNEAKVPYLVGGAYAFARYTGIERHTKDFDIFVRRQDLERTLEVFAKKGGCHTELTFSHWLGKAYCDENFVDVIFSAGNAVAEVDEEWFEHALDGKVLDLPVKLTPAEEMMWSKCFVMERERYDGADVAHLIKACGEKLDWARLVRRFDRYSHVLLAHLVMYNFIYPGEVCQVPDWVMQELWKRLENDRAAPPPASEKLCQGTLVSRGQYLVDVHKWGYQDARQQPYGKMTARQIEAWTEAIETEK